MRRALLSTLPLLVLALSCSPQAAPQPGADSNHNAAAGATPAVPATGWTQIDMIANWAKTSLDVTGHFHTSRNACGQEADGATELNDWNRITTAINAAVQAMNAEQAHPSATPSPNPSESPSSTYTTNSNGDHCMEAPRYTKMDGTAEVAIGDTPNGPKKTLLDARGNQICVKFNNPQVALQLFDALTSVVEAADKEGCPNGWGSN